MKVSTAVKRRVAAYAYAFWFSVASGLTIYVFVLSK